jgi:hypothetical protein
MNNTIKIALLATLALFASGCVTYVAFWGGHRATPAYCYDCHARPGWVRYYTQCDYYSFRVVDGGYYYRPRNARQAKFVYRTYEQKVVRDRQRDHDDYVRKHKAETEKQEKRENKDTKENKKKGPSDKKSRRG